MVYLVQHDQGCPNRMGHSDAAKRVADTYNMHKAALGRESVGYWIACALIDGSSDNVTYESKPDAVKHQHHNENYYTYIQIVPPSMSICAAEAMLKVSRMAYDKGIRTTDGFTRRELIRRLNWDDQNAQAVGRVQNILLGRNVN